MAIKKNEVIVYFSQLPNVQRYWGWFLAIGVLLIALGALAIGYAKWATEFTVILLGCFLAVAGILQIVSGAYARKWTGFTLSLFLGLLYLIAGGVCIFKPIEGALGVSLLIAVLLLFGGCFRLISALRYRFDNWGWVVFNGLASVFLGSLILAEWPSSAIWVIGLFVGIDLLLMGCYWVWLSLAVKR